MGAIVLDLRPGLGLGPFTLGKFLRGLAFAGIDFFFSQAQNWDRCKVWIVFVGVQDQGN